MNQLTSRLRRFGFRTPRTVPALGLSLVLSAAAEEPSPFTKGPYLQVPAPKTVAIMWESLGDHPGLVRFGRDGKLDRQVGPVTPRPITGVSGTLATDPDASATAILSPTRTTNIFYLYTAALTGLKPGATYSYRVELDGTQTPARRFTTLNPKAASVRFIAYGDDRTHPDIHAGLARRFNDYAPAFILHTGDLVARGDDYALWSREFFGPLAHVIDEVPIFPIIGNHEHNCTNYLALTDLPGRQRWYSFDAGPVHVLGLDFHYEKSTDAQFQFARRDLRASRARWKLVFLHPPVFNIGGHASAWGHESYLPLFHQAQVDLVIAGHSHQYERFRPLVSEAHPSEWPITCLTTGGGGANLHTSLPNPALAAHASVHHFLVFEATRDTLRGRAILEDGSVFDRFEIRKVHRRPAPEYLAQIYPEESVELTLDAMRSLTGRAAAVPQRDEAAPVLLTAVPRKNSAPPAELEISLAPESALNYTLENGPLRVTTPPAGATRAVWARVRATGRTKITADKNHDLSPHLVFQATVKAADGETIAYGAKSRLSQDAAEAVQNFKPGRLHP